jgi:hypothetical protein
MLVLTGVVVSSLAPYINGAAGRRHRETRSRGHNDPYGLDTGAVIMNSTYIYFLILVSTASSV